MSIPFPQIDYPRGSLPRGGSDILDTPQASVVLADDMFATAGPAPTVLTGNNVVSTATSTQGAVGQTNVVTGSSARQDNTSVPGAVTQLHTAAGNSVAQGTTSSLGACIQEHLLAGNSARADSSCTAGGVGQDHVLAGTGALAQTTSAAGAVLQAHILVGNGVAADHIAAASAIVQTHILAGADCVSFAFSAEIANPIGLIHNPTVEFLSSRYDAQCFGREYGIGISSDNFDANMESVTLSTVFQIDQRAIAMEN